MPPHLLFILICLLTVAFTLLSGLAKAFGAQQPINPALEGFIEGCEDKPQPCWYGIVPGVTTVEEAHHSIARFGFVFPYEPAVNDTVFLQLPSQSVLCAVALEITDSIVNHLLIQDCQKTAQIGNVAAILGLPYETKFGEEEYSLTYGRSRSISSGCWSLFDHVVSVNLYSPQSSNQASFAWHGFAPLWRYCQLESNNPLCNPTYGCR